MGLRSTWEHSCFFLNDILTYYITDEEYECHPNLVREAL
jgi:hypothetical protein